MVDFFSFCIASGFFLVFFFVQISTSFFAHLFKATARYTKSTLSAWPELSKPFIRGLIKKNLVPTIQKNLWLLYAALKFWSESFLWQTLFKLTSSFQIQEMQFFPNGRGLVMKFTLEFWIAVLKHCYIITLILR